MKLSLTRLTCSASACLLMLSASLHATAQAVETVPSVDLQRYLGRWYEIARFPNRFQKKCISHVSADYRLLENHRIEVANHCKTPSGALDVAVGEARVVDQASNAKLQVSFAPKWLSWMPAVWGDYWIIDLDDRYSVATVGTPNREYLWILSRTPTLPASVYESLIDNATKQGYDTSKLVRTQQ